MNNKTLILLVGLVALLFAAIGCSQAQTNEGGNMAQVTGNAAVELNAAPSFSVETIEGRKISTDQYKNEGKPMVLYFMASTCSTCAKNWKNIDQVYPEYKDKVDLVAVSVDPTDDATLLQNLAKEKGFTFETVAGNPGLAVKYDVKKQTAKFAIDKNGNIVSRHDGLLTPEEWKELFESVL